MCACVCTDRESEREVEREVERRSVCSDREKECV